MAKPEQKLYQILKKNTPLISWDRIENWAIPGLPDLLGYAKNGFFFTVELKVAKGNIIKFSPHQISWHKRHPTNSLILVSCSDERGKFLLFPGQRIMELVEKGIEAEPICKGQEEVMNEINDQPGILVS